MKAYLCLTLFTCCSLLFLSSCSDTMNAIPGPPFAYEDFGTEPIASRLLGPKGKDTQVIARFGTTKKTPPAEGPDIRYVNMEQSMFFLRRVVRDLPKTPENAALRQRLSKTYSRLYWSYSSRRNSFMASPSASYGRGGMNRAFMMPPMPPAI
ncbi:hypothetical protein [Prosthecobacter sp.]|uniref:hypothetical protein n=1 Tax=Prosthecobacter sp. TaxID=1965333 RepID=UPI003783A4AA